MLLFHLIGPGSCCWFDFDWSPKSGCKP